MKTKKKYANVIVLGLLLVSAAAYYAVRTIDFNDLMLAAGYYEEKIGIIQTADIHGHLVYAEATGGYYSQDDVNVEMGLPMIKGIVDELRAEYPNALFVDSGDLFHGTNEANVDEGQGIVDAVNLMGYDAMAVGNHDFNFGFKRMMEIKDQLKFPILTANVFKDGKPAFEGYRIVQVGMKKIGLFGLTTPESKSNMVTMGESGITLEDPVSVAKTMISLLQSEQVDVIVLISHLGDDVDKELVKQVDGIDLILSGHHHWLYDHADKVNQTYIVEPGGYSTHVGFAQLYFKNGKLAKVGWETIQRKDRLKENKEVAAIAQHYFAIALEQGKEVIGASTIPLNGIRSQVRSQETNLGNLIADAMREKTNADIALMNGGGIRESIPAGDISLYSVSKPLPFINSLITLEVKGERIYQALERGVRYWPNGANNGGFLQVSGITYVFDGSKPAGKRLVSVHKDGQPLDKEKSYLVATNDFLFNGGDNYVEFKDAIPVSRGELLKDVLTAYIRNKGVVSPQVENRIQVVNARYK